MNGGLKMSEQIKKIVENAKSSGRKKLLEHESLAVLEAYNIPVAPYFFAKDENEAQRNIDKIGFPVVVKIVSPDIVHKSDVGGVIVNVNSKDELVNAIKSIRANVQKNAPTAEVTGFLVQKMMPKGGLEVIVGGIRDPVFDATVMFGLGGIFVEVLKDVSFRIAPITKEEALEMINEIKARKILEGYRGEAPRDKEAIADIIVKVSKLLYENQELKEMDVNPVIVYEKGAYAVDARFIL
ncbi:acetate--CoA ligase family protein [Fervidicoccus fontis]|nr:acetate--CoA ligase family protein [Fervidicoccus fontis]